MSGGPPRAVVLDSSVWIELLGIGPLAKRAENALSSAREVIVPTVVLFEVFRKIASRTSEEQALGAIAALKQHAVADLTDEIALGAADLSLRFRLGMADSLVLAHAERAGARLVTLDNDFAGCPGVEILR